MNLSDFVSWDTLTTFGGALAMVMVITQFTKDISIMKKLPTQIWSYIISFVVLLLALIFTNKFTISDGVLTLFNALLISIAANGGHSAIQKILGTTLDGILHVDTRDPNADKYDLAFDNLGKITTQKTVTLKVNPNATLETNMSSSKG